MIGNDTQAPWPAFADPVFDAQRAFRGLLDAMARPGTIVPLTVELDAPPPLSIAATAVALTLFDHETPLWLDNHAAGSDVLSFLGFHCGCPIAKDPADAAFAVIAEPAAMPALDRFAIGSDTYPDSSTTIVIDLPSLDEGPVVGLSGPGIDGRATVAPVGLPAKFWDWTAMNRALFPLGVDVILTNRDAVTCLPRTTKTEVTACT
ncbi:MAG: phosphonate C-P lyase system protein PhnH [Pseudomonadota bacterium]